MTDTPMSQPALTHVRDHSDWFLAVGVAFVIGGFFAIAMPFIAGIAVAIVLGWALIFVGALQLIQAWRIRAWGGSAWQLVIGFIVLIGGVAMIVNPIVAVVTLALLLGAIFIAKGATQVWLGLRYRPHSGWGWIVAAGALAVVVGLMIVLSWPFSAAWAPGTLAGISLMFSGWSYVAITLAARRMTG